MTEQGMGINYTPARGVCHEVVRVQVERKNGDVTLRTWEYKVVMRFPIASKVFVLGTLHEDLLPESLQSPQLSAAQNILDWLKAKVVGKLEELVQLGGSQNPAGAVRLVALPPDELAEIIGTLKGVYPNMSVMPHPDYYQSRYSAPAQAETNSSSAWKYLLRD